MSKVRLVILGHVIDLYSSKAPFLEVCYGQIKFWGVA